MDEMDTVVGIMVVVAFVFGLSVGGCFGWLLGHNSLKKALGKSKLIEKPLIEPNDLRD